MDTAVYAPTDNLINWSHILWDKCNAVVKKFQMRIVKALNWSFHKVEKAHKQMFDSVMK